MAARRAHTRESGLTIIEMLIVVTIVGLLAGLTYPSISSGLDSIRLRTTADSIASFLTQAMTRVERTQQPVELVILPAEGRLELHAPQPGFDKEFLLHDGIVVSRILPELPGEQPPGRFFVLMPGATFPGLGMELTNKRGQRRLVHIDPLAGVPLVEIPPEPGEERPK